MKKTAKGGVEGKVIVCTGAAGVLCSSMTEDLLRHGAKVAVLDLRGDVAKKFCADLAKKGLKETLAIEADALDKASLEAACKAVLKKWRRIDVLINGAGGNHPKGTAPAEQMTKDTKLEDSFFGLTGEGFEFVNKLNLIGTVLPCQVFCKEMLKRGGAVLNFCSMAAYQPMTKVAAYGAAKAGIKNFTAFLATHLAPMGIRRRRSVWRRDIVRIPNVRPTPPIRSGAEHSSGSRFRRASTARIAARCSRRSARHVARRSMKVPSARCAARPM